MPIQNLPFASQEEAEHESHKPLMDWGGSATFHPDSSDLTPLSSAVRPHDEYDVIGPGDATLCSTKLKEKNEKAH